MNPLFQPLRLGELQLANRIVMAPMTRSRADSRAVPTAEMVDYYRQRAGAGLIVAEGAAPSAEGLGYCRTPGIFNSEQVAAWRAVTDAVHAEGGQIVLQLMHVGRAASRHNKPAGARTGSRTGSRADTRGPGAAAIRAARHPDLERGEGPQMRHDLAPQGKVIGRVAEQFADLHGHGVDHVWQDQGIAKQPPLQIRQGGAAQPFPRQIRPPDQRGAGIGPEVVMPAAVQGFQEQVQFHLVGGIGRNGRDAHLGIQTRVNDNSLSTSSGLDR